jgi:putative tricarboxylic transport membrane protein
VNVKTQRVADIVLGCIFALLGIFIIYASTFIQGGAAHQLPPDTFPKVVGTLLLLCGAGLALKSWSIKGADLAVPWPDKQGFRTILITIVSLVIYVAVLDLLGLPLATFIYLLFSMCYLKPSKWLLALVISVITAVLAQYLFINLLGLSFPAGKLFE